MHSVGRSRAAITAPRSLPPAMHERCITNSPLHLRARRPGNRQRATHYAAVSRSRRAGAALAGKRADMPRQAGELHIYSYSRSVNHRASISSERWDARGWRGARADAAAGLAPEGFPSAATRARPPPPLASRGHAQPVTQRNERPSPSRVPARADLNVGLSTFRNQWADSVLLNF